MSTAYTAAREQAAFLDRSGGGRLAISGRDRASYLQGLLTNDIAALTPGTGCYAAYLTAQGRMITDMHVYEVGDLILMTLPGDVKDAMLARLDELIFSEDVRLADMTGAVAQVGVVGPRSAALVADVVSDAPVDRLQSLVDHGNLRATWSGTPVIVARTSDTGEPGFDLFPMAERCAAIVDALRVRAVPELTASEADALRIEAGIPRFHRDMDEQTIPLEADLASAISFTKGCYVGQEVIVRVLHRGHGRVARKLVGLRVDARQVPAAGAVVHAADRVIGHVTSATLSPRLDQPIALAYLHRDFIEPGTVVSVGAASATVTALPFA